MLASSWRKDSETPLASAEHQLQDAELVRSIIGFCRLARKRGLRVGTKEVLGCLRALRAIASIRFDTLRWVLRTVLCSSKKDWDQFDSLFAEYWANTEPKREKRPETPRLSGLTAEWAALVRNTSALHPAKEGKTVRGASPIERLLKVDFAQVEPSELAELDRLSVRLLRRLSYRISRRLRPRPGRGVVDLRRTIRRSLGHGGDPIELSFKRPRRRNARLVVLLDVSDSMNSYSLFLLKFAYALKKQFREVSPFIFSTSLVDVNHVLKARRWSTVTKMFSQMTTGWSGGTKIGGSLGDFNRCYAASLLSPKTAMIILSDGWDTGKVEALVAELKRIKSRIGKLIWLNPLLGLEGYEPATRAMSAALPYIDVFAPAHNLKSLLELERHLIAA